MTFNAIALDPLLSVGKERWPVGRALFEARYEVEKARGLFGEVARFRVRAAALDRLRDLQEDAVQVNVFPSMLALVRKRDGYHFALNLDNCESAEEAAEDALMERETMRTDPFMALGCSEAETLRVLWKMLPRCGRAPR